jgi:hypothetical protein
MNARNSDVCCVDLFGNTKQHPRGFALNPDLPPRQK